VRPVFVTVFLAIPGGRIAQYVMLKKVNAQFGSRQSGVCMQKCSAGSWMLQVPAWYLRYRFAQVGGRYRHEGR
jgi:hypothetical protein